MHSDKLTILLDKLTCLKPLGLVIWFGFLRIGSKIQIESTFSDFQTFLKRDPIEDLVWRKNLWIRQQWLWLKHLMPKLCHCMCGKVIVLLSTYTVEVFELQSYYILLKFAKKIILAFNKFIRFSATTNLRILLETEFVYLILCTAEV